MSSQDERRVRPIVFVTGANAGIGFAICQRLLTQLVHRIPPDSIPQPSLSRTLPHPQNNNPNPGGKGNGSGSGNASEFTSEFVGCEGITLILACRTVSKAEAARSELLKHLDDEVERIPKRDRGVNGKNVAHALKFRENVNVVVHRLDLASVKSIFSFAEDVKTKYRYISHLVCNAGVASFIGYDWPLAIKQLCIDFLGAVTAPLYKIQRIGEVSEDGLGWVWQCNVFGHYVLFRLLEPLLSRYTNLHDNQTQSPARVLWMTSVEALPHCYDPSDWQLLKDDKSYEASKFQIELLVGWFEKQQQIQLDSGKGGGREGKKKEVKIRHFLCHPGVVRTNIAVKSLNSLWLDLCMQLTFFMAHFIGSTVHTITPYKAAISSVHLMLVALPFITATTSYSSSTPQTSKYHAKNSLNSSLSSLKDHGPSSSSSSSSSSPSHPRPKPLKFGSNCNYWFHEYVSVSELDAWDEKREQQAEDLVKHCEKVFKNFKVAHNANL